MIQEHWTTVLNFLINNYFAGSITTCILEHPSFKLDLTSSLLPILNIWSYTLPESFERDVYNYSAKEFELKGKGIAIKDDFVKKLTVAIEHSHCESFIVFQDHIPTFANAFYEASTYSVWRSMRNRFIFAFSQDLVSTKEASTYFKQFLFRDQPNLLVVESTNYYSSVFEIKTNRFVGAQADGTWEPLYLLNRYDVLKRSLLFNQTLNVDKLVNLHGREVVIGVFDYKPLMVLDYERHPRVFDRALNKSQAGVLIDGTDIRPMITFCEFRNCTVQADTTETTDWGEVFDNNTGTGIFNLIMKRQIDYGIGGLYLWQQAYAFMDVTHFLGRSGVTCLVPSPNRLISWTLPLRPFQNILWLCVFGGLALQTCALWIGRYFEFLSQNSQNKSKCWQTLCFGIVTSLTIFINQGTNYIINSTTLRMILVTCYMIDIIMTSAYNGGLAAILTLPTFEEAADSRQRLYSHKLIWTGTTDGWILAIDGQTDDPIIASLIQHYHSYPANLITKFSRTENMGFVVERMEFGHLGNSDLIDNAALDRLKLMVDDIYSSYYAAYVPRIWPLLSSFNDFILAWHSSGLDKYWEWKITADYMEANRQNRIVASQRPKNNIGPVKLEMENFMGVVVLWFFGICISFIVFLFELFNGQSRLH